MWGEFGNAFHATNATTQRKTGKAIHRSCVLFLSIRFLYFVASLRRRVSNRLLRLTGYCRLQGGSQCLEWGNGYTVGTKDWKEQNSYDLISKFFGILLTAVAASMGAPFWFDMLNKLINIRSVGHHAGTFR
jgi:hypothetical protein